LPYRGLTPGIVSDTGAGFLAGRCAIPVRDITRLRSPAAYLHPAATLVVIICIAALYFIQDAVKRT